MTGFLDAPCPRWFTIPAHRPFLEDLARGVHAALADGGPEALAQAVILLPTRRAARSLAEAFLKAAGTKAALLPQVRAIGDLDEGEPPFEPGDIALDLPVGISPSRRRFELARLVVANERLLERRLDAASALELADALATFLDSCQIEEVGDPDAVRGLAGDDLFLAQHWKLTAQFLDIALSAWPKRLVELGLADVAARRVALLRRLGERWRERPPHEVLIAAGSTGTAPAAADLLAAVAGAPRGCVVLPGLDQALAESAWDAVGEQHPQGSMRRLLKRARVERDGVRAWDPAAETQSRGRWRRRLINEALRPAEATGDWLKQIGDLRAEAADTGVDPIAEGLKGLAVVTARHDDEAAAAIALMMRETLEAPGVTCALVTPDGDLARRVSARLTRWGVVANSSSGQPLAGYPVGVLASLAARAIVDPTDPVGLLAVLKHPLTRLGMAAEDLDRARVALERHGLRGARPQGFAGVARRLNAAGEPRDGDTEASLAARRQSLAEAGALLARTQACLARLAGPFAAGDAVAADAARAVAETLEALSERPDGRPTELWTGLAGEVAAGLFSALMEESEGLPPISAHGFADLFDSLLARELVRPGGASHPRLKILGVLEARLIRADRLILAGLEEGVWPAIAPVDPFLSRPMRAKLGLPPPERRIGLSAHDFAQAASAPEVVLVRRERRGGAPAVASRWLWRLETLAKGAGLTLPGADHLIDWARDLDAPGRFRPQPRPRPKPPVAARPRQLPVTGVERWVRDPYSIYGQYVLRLRPLDPPDAPIEALARGAAIHAAFEKFALDHPDALPAAAEAVFTAMLEHQLREAGMPEGQMTRELALAANVAPWVTAFERERRVGARLLVEQSGRMTLNAPAGPFTLTAKADRIEHRGARADILDFKTGRPPSPKQVDAGFAPQLTLTAAILAAGGFAAVGPALPGQLAYVRVSGGRTPGKVELRGEGEEAAAAAKALAGLLRRIEAFDDAATPYISWAAPQFVGKYHSDFNNLARLWEWHVIGEDDADGPPT